MAQKFTLQPEDGSVQHGDLRGDGSVDLQVLRTSADEVASGYGAIIVGGEGNKASGDYSGCVGFSNEASGTGTLAMGYNNTASGSYSFAAGFNSFSEGIGSAALGYEAFAVGAGSSVIFCTEGVTTVLAPYGSVVGGYKGKAYSYGQQSFANGAFSVAGDAQQSKVIYRAAGATTSPVPIVAYTNGAGASTAFAPDGTNRLINATVDYVAVVTSVGSGAPLVVGDALIGKDLLLLKKVSGTVTVKAPKVIESDTTTVNMAGAAFTYSIVSGALVVAFTPPTTANGTTFRILATVTLNEVGW